MLDSTQVCMGRHQQRPSVFKLRFLLVVDFTIITETSVYITALDLLNSDLVSFNLQLDIALIPQLLQENIKTLTAMYRSKKLCLHNCTGHYEL